MTGKIPREVILFKYFEQNLEEYYNNRFQYFHWRANKVLNDLPQNDQKKFIEYLENLIDIGFAIKKPLITGRAIYYQGIVYKKRSSEAFPINEPARDALLSIYVDKYNIEPILSKQVSSLSLFSFSLISLSI